MSTPKPKWDAYPGRRRYGGKSRQKVNSPLARRLARIYEKEGGLPFPGGERNATISRTNAGSNQRSEGAWSWQLDPIDTSHGHPLPFGSQWPAREAVENTEMLSWT